MAIPHCWPVSSLCTNFGSVAQFGRAVSVCKGREPWFSVPCPVELQVVRPSAGPRTRTRRSNPSTPDQPVSKLGDAVSRGCRQQFKYRLSQGLNRIFGLATPLTARSITLSWIELSVLEPRRKTGSPLFTEVLN